MCQEPTELLWIGCLTGLISILKNRFGTLIPNINSQTFSTKCNFTRDEWNTLLHLFNISHFSSTCCVKNSSLISCPNTMAKRMQEQKGERSVAISKSTATNLSSHVPTSSLSAKSPIASQSPGILVATGKPCKQDERKLRIRRSVQFSSATERCILWLADRQSHGENLSQQKRNQGMRTFPNLKLGVKKM